jgi:hypothetical protein
MSRFSANSETISRIGVILTRTDDKNETRFLLMKRFDRSWVDTDGYKVKWGFPKTGQNLTEHTNILRTGLNVCENKLKTTIATRRFHCVYKISAHRLTEDKNRSIEYYWMIDEKEQGEFLHLSGTKQDGSMDTQYIWVTLDELKALNKYDAICFGTKQWLYKYSNEFRSRESSPVPEDMTK